MLNGNLRFCDLELVAATEVPLAAGGLRALLLQLPVRKTSQGGSTEEKLWARVVEIRGVPEDPVACMLEYLSARGFSFSDAAATTSFANYPIFNVDAADMSDAGQSHALAYDTMRTRVVELARLSRLPDHQRFTLHGLRRGGAQDLAARGAPAHVIMAIGDWASHDTMVHYLGQPAELSLLAATAYAAGQPSARGPS